MRKMAKLPLLPEKRFPLGLTSALCLATASALCAQEGEVIIDTRFNQPPGAIQTSSRAGDFDPALPTRAAARHGSTLEIPAEPPPGMSDGGAVVFQTRQGEEGDPGAARLHWDLGGMGLQTGVYELECSFLLLDSVPEGPAVEVLLAGDDGKEHVLSIRVGNGRFFFGRSGPPAEPEVLYKIRALFDLGERTWSLWINDNPEFAQEPLPEKLLQGGLSITGVMLRAVNPKGTDTARFAFGPVKLTHRAAPPAK